MLAVLASPSRSPANRALSRSRNSRYRAAFDAGRDDSTRCMPDFPGGRERVLDEAEILPHPIVEPPRHGIGFMRQPIRTHRSRGLRRRGDRLDQKTSAAHAAGRRIDVQILQIAGVLGRPGVLVKQEMHDAEDAIGRVARAQAAYASVEYALPRGQGGGGGKYHDVEAL